MTMKKRRREPQFELTGGVVCLDYVNTLDDRFSDEPKELLKSYSDLARFAEDTGVLSDHQVDHLVANSMKDPKGVLRVLASGIKMREAMHEVFWALVIKKPVPVHALSVLNTFVQDAARHASLVPRGAHFHWQFDPAPTDLEAPLWPIARSAAELLASEQLAFVRACASKTCEWLFLDESKNHRRRWCDMTKCGNRAKVRSFYTRKKRASQ
jgi:predicted RNA-binding Zn ribbon-like protein